MRLSDIFHDWKLCNQQLATLALLKPKKNYLSLFTIVSFYDWKALQLSFSKCQIFMIEKSFTFVSLRLLDIHFFIIENFYCQTCVIVSYIMTVLCCNVGQTCCKSLCPLSWRQQRDSLPALCCDVVFVMFPLTSVITILFAFLYLVLYFIVNPFELWNDIKRLVNISLFIILHRALKFLCLSAAIEQFLRVNLLCYSNYYNFWISYQD